MQRTKITTWEEPTPVDGNITKLLVPPPTTTTQLAPTIRTAVLDSGTSGNYIALTDASHIKDLRQCDAVHSIVLPDGSILQSSQAGTLNVPVLPKEALVAYLFPELSVSLVSVGGPV